MRSVICFVQYEASSIVVYATEAMDKGSRHTRKERPAVVEAWQNE